MKKIAIVFLAISISAAQAQTKVKVKTGDTKTKTKTSAPAPSPFKSSNDSLSYAMGMEGATFYKNQGIASVNAEMVKKAFDDVFSGKTPLLTNEVANMTIQKKLQEFMGAKASKEKEAGKKFLEENKKRPGVVVLPSGLQYEILKAGTGDKPKITDTVKAHYIGTLINGTEFDNSYKRGEPLEIPVGGVIQGWVEALQLMPVGSKWKLFIPSELGYGDRGAGGSIPGGSALVFEVELVDIVHHK
jgi:FKBP-type peptidyl-prolyl cis-trans isomerase FklB